MASFILLAFPLSVASSATLGVYWSSVHNDNAVLTAAFATTLDKSYSYFADNLWVVSDTSVDGLVPLNFYANAASNHHITTASVEGNAFAKANGYTFVGVQGYVYAEKPASPYAFPLEMWYQAARGDHFLVGTPLNRADAQGAGYVFQYVDCYTVGGNFVVWPNTPPPGFPFPVSTDLTGFQYLEGGNAVPPGIRADTWFPSWAADGNLYSSWTDGVVDGVKSGSGGDAATTGFAIITGDDPFNLSLSGVSTYVESAAPYQGRYPSLNYYRDGVWYYGTYSLENYGAWYSPPPSCGNWCILGPFCSIRTSTDEGKTWTDLRRNMTSYDDNLFGETAFNNTKVRFGAAHAVDFGKNSEHAPGGQLYIVGTGAETPESHQSWMQGDSVYLARTTGVPDPATVNTKAAWEFNAGGDTWVPDVEGARPLFVWPGRTGVVTLTWWPELSKFIMVISTPSSGCSTVGNFDTYFLESDNLTGPFSLITYLSAYGPEAYFVHLPTKFLGNVSASAAPARKRAVNTPVPRGGAVTIDMTDAQVAAEANGTAAWANFFLSYSADFASGQPNPPGSGYHWSLQQSRFGVTAAFAERLARQKAK